MARNRWSSRGLAFVCHWLCQCRQLHAHSLWHRRASCWWLALILASALVEVGCSRTSSRDATADNVWPPDKLSAYGLFVGTGATQKPVDDVVPYDLNTPLFSDYTEKLRFVRLPPGEKIGYHESNIFDFPVGTVIAKTFAYPHDMRDPSKGRRLLETRILEHRPDGWTGLPYIWNEEQTEATLDLAGGSIDVAWRHSDGTERKNRYLIPNANQCKGCHKADGNDRPMRPLGPTARQLNRDFVYADGKQNQLERFSKLGLFTDAVDAAGAPRLPVWDDPATGSVDQRARAWMEINCAHCHNPNGPGKNSGLDLHYAQSTPAKLGIFKSPVAAGRGTGGRLYDIVPGKPDESILLYRIASDQPQVMMPELGKRLIHTEAVELVRQWIAEMPEERPSGE